MSKHHVILSANGAVTSLREIIQAGYPNYTDETISELIDTILDGFVFKCSDKEKAPRLLKAWAGYCLGRLDLPPYPYHPVTVAKDGSVDIHSKLHDKRYVEVILHGLGIDLYKQLQEYNLYDKDGRLMYVHHNINDSCFNDIALTYSPFYSLSDDDE